MSEFTTAHIVNDKVPVSVVGSLANVDANAWENPYGTPQGQFQVGISEGLIGFFARKGLLKERNVLGAHRWDSSTASNQIMDTVDTVPVGKKHIALKICVSSDTAGQVMLRYNWNDGAAPNYGTNMRYVPFYISPKQPLIVDFDGGVWSGEGQNLCLLFIPDATGAKVWASMLFAEV